MRVLTVAATKGGVGKTTLVANLALEGIRRGKKVAILDLDPQGSLIRWHELRSSYRKGSADTPHLIIRKRYIDSAIHEAAEQGWDILLIDTPPGSIERTEQAVAEADLVIVPVRPSPIDVESMDAIVELCEEQGARFAFVLNSTKPRSTMTEGARAALARQGEVLDLEVLDRVAYAAAMLKGSSGAETDKAAAGEIAALWDALDERMRAAERAARKKKAS